MRPIRSRALSALRLPCVLAACACARPAAVPPPAPEPASEHGALSLAPSADGVGLDALYRRGRALPDAGRLVLRARLRTPLDTDEYLGGVGTETRAVAELTRGPRGEYRGRFRLPDSVVYAVFLVETPDGRQVDGNGRRGWEWLAAAPDGRPLAAALDQRGRDLTRRNPLLGLETARERVRLYPDEPEGWRKLRFFESVALGSTGTDSLARARGADYARLAQRFRSGAATGDDLAGMWGFAASVGDTAGAREWRDRLLREHPRHPRGAWVRVGRVMERHRADPAAALPELESLWDEVGAGDEAVVPPRGLEAALAAGDGPAALRWAERMDRFVPVMDGRLALALAGQAVTRREGMRRLERRLGRLEEARDEDRPLFVAAGVQRDRNEEESAALWSALGAARLVEGDTTGGREAFARAVRLGWAAGVLRDAAEGALAAGDTASALHAWAKLAADRDDAGAPADSLRRRAGAHYRVERWSGRVAEMRRLALERTRRGQVDRPAWELAAAGVEGAATVVVFGRTTCGYTLHALPQIDELRERVRAGGAALVLVSDEEASPEVERRFRERGYRGPILHDPRRGSHAAFGSASTPEYFVVDRSGRIRYEYSTLDELPRQVASLTESSGR
ncbi:MAG: TlpA disulfide reductase family protein [Gemmatimonadota bacterium]